MQIDLRYFSADEFHGWFDDVSPRALILLDAFRHGHGGPVMVSPHPAAVGRRLGSENTSQHNIDHWSEVRAIDVMPSNMTTRDSAWAAVRLATFLGFTGIGVYPDWLPTPGLHLDVRQDQRPGSPATWGMVRDAVHKPQRVVTINVAISKLPDDKESSHATNETTWRDDLRRAADSLRR